MDLLPDTGNLALRYTPYIQELQEFFAIHGLLCGAPQHLTPLANRLGIPGTFATELASMVRSVIFRERGSMPHSNLLALVALAGGGPNIEVHAYDVQPSIETLSGFLASVSRAPMNQAQPLQSDPTNPQPVQLEPEPLEYELAPQEPLALFAPQSHAPSPIVELAAAPDLLLKSPTDRFLTAAPLPATDLKNGQPAAILEARSNNRPLWVIGAIALPLILLAALLHHHLSSNSTHNPASSPAPNPASLASASQSPIPHGPTPLPPTTPSPAAIQPPTATPSRPASSPANPLASPATSTATLAAAAAVSARATPRNSLARSAPAPARTPAHLQPPIATQAVSHSTPQPTEQAETDPPTLPATAPAAHPAEAPSVSGHGGSFDVASGIMSSHLLSSSAPKYPELAKIAHVEGPVILQAVVAKSGRVAAVKVLSGHRLLRKAAVNAVRDWRYRPYLADGRPVDVATIITLDFKLPH